MGGGAETSGFLITLFSCLLHQRPPAEGLQFPPRHQHLEPFGHHRRLLLHALRRHEQPDRGVTHPVRPGPGRSVRYALSPPGRDFGFCADLW